MINDNKQDLPKQEKNRYTHKIIIERYAPYFRPRKLNPKMLEATEEHFSKSLQVGIVKVSNSEYASPLHLVPKGRGEYRFVGDHRALNRQTIKKTHMI